MRSEDIQQAFTYIRAYVAAECYVQRRMGKDMSAQSLVVANL